MAVCTFFFVHRFCQGGGAEQSVVSNACAFVFEIMCGYLLRAEHCPKYMCDFFLCVINMVGMM